MSKKQRTQLPRVNQLKVAFTGKAVTAFGGLPLTVAKFFEQIDLRGWTERSVPVTETSPNAKGVYEKFLGLFLTILAGGRRFAHLIYFRHGMEVLQKAFGTDWLPQSTSVVTRFFKKFDRQSIAEKFREEGCSLSRWLWWDLEGIKEDNLNFDSSVCVRYGRQQGANRGYNPKKPGRGSHHPLIAFLGSGFVANLWNRSGNTSSAGGIKGFFEQTRLILGESFRVKRVLCDSGFYLIAFIKHLEGLTFRYIIAARICRALQREIRKIIRWEEIEEGIEVAEFRFKHAAKGWDRERRYVVVRQAIAIRPRASGKQPSLFKELEPYNQYRYSLYITNDEQAEAVEIWREYRPRACDENVVKVLKEDYGLDGFCLDNFWATEAVMVASAVIFYNLMHYLTRNFIAPQGPHPQLKTLRARLFIIPAILGRDGRQSVIRVAVKDRKTRGKLISLLHRISNLSSTLPNSIAVVGAQGP